MTRMIALAALAASAFVAPATAQTRPPSPTVKVLAIGRVTTTGGAVQELLSREVRDTVELYLSGKIDQWFVRTDQNGVVFVVNAASTEEAKQILDALPLVKVNALQFDFVPLGPLSPLRLLLAAPVK